MAYYVISKALNGQFYWNFKANNHQTILISETFIYKDTAKRSIESSKSCTKSSNFDIKPSTNNQYYFVQKADNGEVLGTSETYITKYGCENAIEVVKNEAPTAQVIDATS